MSDRFCVENIKRYPDIIKKFVDAEMKIGHTWKNKKSLKELYDSCLDIDERPNLISAT